MASTRPMVRLLQGDVGCGKTIVALHAIAAAADGGYQTAIMAPTEILAEQHAITLRDYLAPLGIEIVVLTGSTADARGVRARIADGSAQVVVGTHALIQGSTQFHRLGLAVIDEQHRFGVMQRGTLAEKGWSGHSSDDRNADSAHVGDHRVRRHGHQRDRRVAAGRTPVKTRRITPAKVADMYDYLRKQAACGLQTYIVCPLVEESSARDAKAVTKHYEELVSGPLNGLRVGLMHGRLASREKDAVMHAFKRGELDALISTSVIEVGIDCPNATTMIIEDASQFGLTQLHQLRGRVGRGSEASHCFLLGKAKTDDGRKRVEIMCATTNGFDIAEADLELRGPGEFQGVRQAGMGDLRVADLVRDARLLDAARRDAEELLTVDPNLKKPEHAALAQAAERFAEVNAYLLRAGFPNRIFLAQMAVGKPASEFEIDTRRTRQVWVWRIAELRQSRAKIWAIRSPLPGSGKSRRRGVKSDPSAGNRTRVEMPMVPIPITTTRSAFSSVNWARVRTFSASCTSPRPSRCLRRRLARCA